MIKNRLRRCYRYYSISHTRIIQKVSQTESLTLGDGTYYLDKKKEHGR